MKQRLQPLVAVCRKLFLSIDVIKELVFHKNDFSSRVLNARDHSVPDSLRSRVLFSARSKKRRKRALKLSPCP